MLRCERCGFVSDYPRPRCPACHRWGTIGDEDSSDAVQTPVSLAEVESEEADRFSMGIPDIDTLFGGGFVRGCTYLMSGSPGAGKSTLLLQLLAHCKKPVRLVLGEERASAIADRAKRLKIKKVSHIYAIETNDIDEALDDDSRDYEVNVIDSIHTMTDSDVNGPAGSVHQIVACLGKTSRYTMASGSTAIVIAHVNKAGELHGPMALPHLVTTVSFLEVLSDGILRRLSIEKNRHGPTIREADGKMYPMALNLRMTPQGLVPQGFAE